MSEYSPLSPEDKAQIINEFMKSRLQKTQGMEQPKIVLIGAQPGAGKSKAAALVKNELRQEGGYVHVDADIMRALIPAPDSIVYSSAQTQLDAGSLAAGVRNTAKEHQRNIVEEGTFRDAVGISKFISDRKSEGYGVEMLAVATAPEESIAGIFMRYEEQHGQGVSQPRFVDESYHNIALDGFKNTLSQCEPDFNRVRITNRSGDILYDSQSQQNQYKSAKEALESHQQLTPKRLKQVQASWDKVESMAAKRGSDPVENYFERIAQHRDEIGKRLEAAYKNERVAVTSKGITVERKSGDTWRETEKTEVAGMKAGVYLLGTAKPAEKGQSYSGEIIHKDAASVFQKTEKGLVRHSAFELGNSVALGQYCTIKREDGQKPEISQAQASGRRMKL